MGDLWGVIAAFAVLVALAGYIFSHSLKAPVNSSNVNDEWDENSDDAVTAARADAHTAAQPAAAPTPDNAADAAAAALQ